MHTILRSLLAIAALAACAPGTVIVVREPVSNPRPAPRPAPAPLAPLEVDIGRPHRGQLLVQTNRPAYVALFEIIPERGVTLVHPSNARERRFMVSGPRRMPTWFDESEVTTASSRGREQMRYIYVLASDEPLRITDDAFHAEYLRRVLGPITYRGTNPYTTMRAIAARFAPNVRDEKWAEDVWVLDSHRRAEPQHVARVYCPGGVVLEIPEELADRAWCPARRGGRPVAQQPGAGDHEPPPTRPDSVKGNNGRRVQMRAHGTPGEQPRSRVREPMTMPAGQPASIPAAAPTNPPGQVEEKPGERRGQDEIPPGQRRGQGEDRPGQRRGQAEEKPGNGPPPGAGVPGTPAQPGNQRVAKPDVPPGQAAHPQKPETHPGQTSQPSGRGRGQQQASQKPDTQQASRNKPDAAQPQREPAPVAAPPQSAKPASPPATQPTPTTPAQAAQPQTGQPAATPDPRPAPSAQPPGRGQAKKAAPDSTTPPDTTSQAKPGKAKPPASGRPPVPLPR